MSLPYKIEHKVISINIAFLKRREIMVFMDSQVLLLRIATCVIGMVTYIENLVDQIKNLR